MLKKFHPFHMVEKSPWPILASNGALLTVTSTLLWINTDHKSIIMAAMLVIMIIGTAWWRDVSREAIEQGCHLSQVTKGLQIGMILFITSEVMFFLSFFWAFFHSSISPNVEMGQMWPPASIKPFNPMNIPLLNTIILLSSGVTVTWAHHELLNKKFKETVMAMTATVTLGILFTALQAFEYKEASFTIADSAYGSTFFMTTGFHGLHVIIGSTFLVVTNMRIIKKLISSDHVTGFECAAWYWHFVDVVWLFLYSMMYWWGS